MYRITQSEEAVNSCTYKCIPELVTAVVYDVTIVTIIKHVFMSVKPKIIVMTWEEVQSNSVSSECSEKCVIFAKWKFMLKQVTAQSFAGKWSIHKVKLRLSFITYFLVLATLISSLHVL